ncbi:DUF6235 family protein [Actinomycetes bacterium KLBMP 9797]
MTVPMNPARGVRRPLRRLDHGHALLERWSAGANQIERNAVYKALFAVLEDTVHSGHIVLGGDERSGAFSVLVRQDLVVDVRIDGEDSFALVGIVSLPGPAERDRQ